MIAVTGITGFLGVAVYDRLPKAMPYGPQLHGCKVVVHLAGETKDPRLMYLSNVLLTKSILAESGNVHVTRFVFISSMAVKDLEDGYTVSSYAWSKWACEQLVKQSSLDTRIVRLPTVYSTGMKNWYIMAVKSLLRGQNPWNMISLEEAVSRILKEAL